MPLPDFLIVGAARSGTTSLHRYLRGHPEVFLPDLKEPDFFAGDERVRTIRTMAEYERLFAGAGRAKAIGEASVAYLFDEGAARRIRDTLGPETRIVAVLRNPVDALYSLWGFLSLTAGETLSFEDALAAEEGRLAGTVPVPPGGLPVEHYAYVARMRYARQLRRYLDAFGQERVHVDLFEEFFADPASAFAGVCRFLGVDPGYVPRFETHNPSGRTRCRLLGNLVNRRARWKELGKAVLPPRARDRLRDRLNRLNTKARPLSPLPRELRARLQETLDADVRELELLLGRSLRAVWW